MTILISVISEAYSSKYHSILTNDAFDTAVKAFRSRTDRQRSTVEVGPPSRSSSLERRVAAGGRISLLDVKTSIETVSQDLIEVARQFHDHLHYFSTASASNGQPPPESLRMLLSDLADAEKMDEKLKENMLQDDEARKVRKPCPCGEDRLTSPQMLFVLSYESALTRTTLASNTHAAAVERLRKLINKAETTIAMLGERSDEIEETDDLLEQALRRRQSRAAPEDTLPTQQRTAFIHPGGCASQPDMRTVRIT